LNADAQLRNVRCTLNDALAAPVQLFGEICVDKAHIRIHNDGKFNANDRMIDAMNVAS
jgi:hypothetical protein